jgi:PleD family two-component response regulator
MPETEQRKKAMDGLFRVIQVSTRRCDVFARFSASQYVLLLPTTSIENCDLVLKRISRMYKQNFRVAGIDMHTKIQPLETGSV